ncbi:MAG: hypothetical protein ABSF48_21995 [Thermodesulfobacteriota bacterium]|jgi:hypothetical protein
MDDLRALLFQAKGKSGRDGTLVQRLLNQMSGAEDGRGYAKIA